MYTTKFKRKYMKHECKNIYTKKCTFIHVQNLCKKVIRNQFLHVTTETDQSNWKANVRVQHEPYISQKVQMHENVYTKAYTYMRLQMSPWKSTVEFPIYFPLYTYTKMILLIPNYTNLHKCTVCISYQSWFPINLSINQTFLCLGHYFVSKIPYWLFCSLVFEFFLSLFHLFSVHILYQYYLLFSLPVLVKTLIVCNLRTSASCISPGSICNPILNRIYLWVERSPLEMSNNVHYNLSSIREYVCWYQGINYVPLKLLLSRI